MRIAENVILGALLRGGCIKSFYRLSARQAARSAVRIPDGYVLEVPGEPEDILLSQTDFQALEKLLVQTETWEQTVGTTCFGGATWVLT
ncbi:cytoplasmic protein [Klebsiella aerogenes]|nr:cytoplasmic protein [Klebsiella aerogenes]ELY3087515.1 cytoplasmic protein [Klebsiella aerogenes]